MSDVDKVLQVGCLDHKTRCAYSMRMAVLHKGSDRRGGTRATNISLNAALVEEAKAFGVNISLAAASGLEQAVSRKRAERWAEENGEALASYNEYVEAQGLPLSSYRLF